MPPMMPLGGYPPQQFYRYGPVRVSLSFGLAVLMSRACLRPRCSRTLECFRLLTSSPSSPVSRGVYNTSPICPNNLVVS